jgi:hypothetical protein
VFNFELGVYFSFLQPLDIQQQSKPCSAASAPSHLETHQRQQIKGGSKDLYYHWNHRAFRKLVQRLLELLEILVLKLFCN